MMATNVQPAVIAIFGATGDLAHRKLIPALYEMSAANQLPTNTSILGLGRKTDVTDDEFRLQVRKSIRDFVGSDSEELGHWCEKCIHYLGMGDSTSEDFKKLRDKITAIERTFELPCNRIFYLATPPQAFGPTIEGLGEAGLNNSEGYTRLVIEKPFGHDLKSAEALNDLVHKHFREDQIYRIDHYLGKETVQNLLAFRFGNALFESVWNREKIEKIEILVAEELGVEQRADYYEKSGALRDMVQNHLTQLLTLTAMEIPTAFKAGHIRYEKVKVLNAITPIHDEDIVEGQYTEGEIGGQGVRGYKSEDGVKKDSKTPTFVSLRLHVENWRWSGVPFYLTTGKRLKERRSEIVVTFRRPPVTIFKPEEKDRVHPNVLVIALQPNEGFRISFEVKKPGSEMAVKTEWMQFSYADSFGPLPDAYHTLLYDILEGDQTLFVSADETLASWRLYTPVLHSHHSLYPYPAGSWGPKEAQKLRG